jgi:Alginate export
MTRILDRRRRSADLGAATIVLLLAPVSVWPAMAQVAPVSSPPAAAPEFVRPTYQGLRHNEDWSVLKNKPADAPADPFDPIKYVAFDESGAIWASFGGQFRLRAEWWDNFNLGARAAGVETDDVFGLSRLLLHADLHLGESFRLFAQAKSSLATDRQLAGGKRAIDRDDLDLQNAFAEWGTRFGEGGKFWVRAGRQELLFGKQRLISPLDWVNTRRTFEGFASLVKSGAWTVNAFWVHPVLVAATDFNDADDSADLYGLYGVRKSAGSKASLEFYLLGLDRERATFADVTGVEERQTLGLRYERTAGPFDYEFEAGYQIGDLGSADIAAVMVTGVFGFTNREHVLAPRFYTAVDFASGDRRPRDGKVETFSHLYPLSHAHLGYMDFVGRQNIVDFQLGCQWKLGKTSGSLDWHGFYLDSANDGLYGTTGVQARKANPGGSKAVGNEIDVVLRRPLNAHLSMELGLSHFFAGRYLEQTGASEDVNWAYWIGQYTF